MKSVLAFGAVLALLGATGWAIIDVNFTPKHLAEQADVIFSGKLEPTDNSAEWKLIKAVQIKGQAAGTHVLSLAKCKKDHVKDIAQAFVRHVKDPAILFAGTLKQQKQAFMHLSGMWLGLKSGGKDRWDVDDYALNMSGTYAGGTDMLIRMSQYLVEDVDSHVPVSANVRWAGDAVKVTKLNGECSGMAVVAIGGPGKMHLFVGSPDGDKLFGTKKGEFEVTFHETTAAAKLDTKSRRFTWMDVNGDGQADLVTWDGRAVSVRLVGKDGKFTPAGKGWSVAMQERCTALSACSTDGRAGVLVSTEFAPALLVADGKTGWKKKPMPAGQGQEMLGQMSPCVVADLDRDGRVDVLEPGEEGGILWKGKAGGFGPPAKVNVSTRGGAATVAVGDFNEDGFLDIFLAGAEKNTLWENDGKGAFKEVFRYSGSMSYKCPARSTEAKAVDLNHDGRMDICLIYPQSDILYHFNRGFRAFGEEGEVRLPGLETDPGQPRLGQKTMTVGDLNGDGSHDLVVLVTNGLVYFYPNDQYDMPALRLRLAKGTTGPVSASCWVGDKFKVCAGTAAVAGHSPPAYICARYPGKCKVKWVVPGKGEQVKTVTVEDGPVDVILTPGKQKPAGKK